MSVRQAPWRTNQGFSTTSDGHFRPISVLCPPIELFGNWTFRATWWRWLRAHSGNSTGSISTSERAVRVRATVCLPRLELDDQPSSRTTSLQPTMGVRRPLRRIDLCHTKHNFAGLDLLSEPIELLELLRVRAHKGRREVDISLRDALESADGREGAAVTNSGDDKLIEYRSVREPIDPLREMAANP